MTVHMITGRLGSGKTLVATSRLWEFYVAQGRPVAVNYPLYVEHATFPFCKAWMYRLPDYPTSSDLYALPAVKVNGTVTTESIEELETWPKQKLMDYLGGYSEKTMGLLCLDEASHYLDARNWSGEERARIVRWLTQARKYGWDIYLIVQHPSMIDKQIRDALSELVVECRRTDRYSIPLISKAVRLVTGLEIKFFRLHIGLIRQGLRPDGVVIDRWYFRATNVFRSYDTRYIFSANQRDSYRMLDPYTYYGRTVTPGIHLLRLFIQAVVDFNKAHIQPLHRPVALALGIFIGSFSAKFNTKPEPIPEPQAKHASFAQQKKPKSDPWKDLTLALEFGTERVYVDPEGNPVDVEIKIQNGQQSYCIKDSCRF